MARGLADFKELIREMIYAWARYNNRTIMIDERVLEEQSKVASDLYGKLKELRGRGVVIFLEAPTGSGKTEIYTSLFLAQFREGEWFTPRVYIVSPIHALLTQLAKRIKVYSKDVLKMSQTDKFVGEDHGEVSEPTFLYKAPITLTTIDSYAYGYLSKRVFTWITSKGVETGRYSMPAGLQALSLTVLDEAHLIQDEAFLGPRVMAKIISDITSAGGIVMVSSATLSTGLIKYLKQEIDRRSIDSYGYTLKGRSRKIRISCKLDKELSAEDIACEGGTLVIVNSVAKAREISAKLAEKCKNLKILTLHSLMRRADRERVAEELDYREKRKLEDIILVGTQSVEVGIDFSFNKLYTELAPIDSLLQRIGRVGRFEKTGSAVIYSQGSNPYPSSLLERTKDILKEDLCREELIDLANVGHIKQLLDKVYSSSIIDEVANRGDELYAKTLEYLNNLHILARPPEEEVYIKPSFYINVYLLGLQDLVLRGERNDRREAGVSEDRLRNSYIRYSIPEIDVQERRSKIEKLVQLLRFASQHMCEIYVVSGRERERILLKEVRGERFESMVGRGYSIVVACEDLSVIYEENRGLKVEEVFEGGGVVVPKQGKRRKKKSKGGGESG